MARADGAIGGSETVADVYDRLFVPAVMSPWAVHVADAAQLQPGDRVLDVACGTGAVTHEASRRVGSQGSVAGIDLSPDMLAVARRKLHGVNLQVGRAEELPFEDATFDAVTCQFGLMFFDDRHAALQQMRRVLRPGGRLSLAVWDSLDRTPPYAALTQVIERHLGTLAGVPMRAAFSLGNTDLLRAMIQGAGFAAIHAETSHSTVRFASMTEWVQAEVKGWIGAAVSGTQYASLMEDAHRVLGLYQQPDGKVEFTMPATIATARKEAV